MARRTLNITTTTVAVRTLMRGDLIMFDDEHIAIDVLDCEHIGGDMFIMDLADGTSTAPVAGSRTVLLITERRT